jgi:hypothetical protein
MLFGPMALRYSLKTSVDATRRIWEVLIKIFTGFIFRTIKSRPEGIDGKSNVGKALVL